MAISKNYSEFKINIKERNSESVYNILYRFGINNLLEDNNFIKAYLPENKSKIFHQIKKNLVASGISIEKDFSIKRFVNKDWTKEWKKTIKPVYIKRKIIVYPSWLRKDVKKYDNRILIEIDPKMSFGTGHNETTQLMLELMCDYVSSEDENLLDFGSGTGVLAMAGIRLGLKKAVAIDTDEDSIRDSKEYIRKNGLNDKIKIQKKNISQIKEKNFCVICANILSTVIKENIKYIFEKSIPSGKIFLSGILKEEESMIRKFLLKNSFKIIDIRYKSEWIGIYARKNS